MGMGDTICGPLGGGIRDSLPPLGGKKIFGIFLELRVSSCLVR